jgi:hypothetical protein
MSQSSCSSITMRGPWYSKPSRRTVIRLGHLNDAPKEYTVIIFDVNERQLGEAKSDKAPPNQKHQI